MADDSSGPRSATPMDDQMLVDQPETFGGRARVSSTPDALASISNVDEPEGLLPIFSPAPRLPDPMPSQVLSVESALSSSEPLLVTPRVASEEREDLHLAKRRKIDTHSLESSGAPLKDEASEKFEASVNANSVFRQLRPSPSVR